MAFRRYGPPAHMSASGFARRDTPATPPSGALITLGDNAGNPEYIQGALGTLTAEPYLGFPCVYFYPHYAGTYSLFEVTGDCTAVDGGLTLTVDGVGAPVSAALANFFDGTRTSIIWTAVPHWVALSVGAAYPISMA